MISQLLQKNVQEFIEQHAGDDEQQLLLKHKTIFDLPASIIAWQISGKRKAKTKIPLYYNTRGVVYPPGLNLEQSSSEETARFKASILEQVLPKKETLVDLTGGFGIDSLFFSRVFKKVVYVERNAELIEYAKHNHQVLKANAIVHVHSTTEDALINHSEKTICFFIDPSRRTTSNQKVFKLADCEPDITKLQTGIFNLSEYLLVKTSPMLDIQQGLSELKFVKHVWVVSVDNEVKELLFLCTRGFTQDCLITAINLPNKESISLTIAEERNQSVSFSNPLAYIYEPYAAILKAGAFKLLANKFDLKKLQQNTHLYTSDKLVENFPGRIFRVEKLIKADAKSAAEVFSQRKTNVLTRNYPLSPDELKKKLKLQDGGEQYLIGCSGEKEKFLIAAARLK